MPIPNAENAFVPDAKAIDYLLNNNHPDGGSKASWFKALGYTKEMSHVLVNDLIDIARECEEFETETTKFGVKYIACGLIGIGEFTGNIKTVWIVEKDNPPRLITAYPNELK